MNYPKRADFERNPRSKQIRDISLRMLAVLETPMDRAQPTDKIYKLIAYYRKEFVMLGISAGMRTGLPTEMYTDPVMASEYLAGQLLNLCLIQLQTRTGVFYEFMGEQQALTTADTFLDRSQQEKETIKQEIF